MGEGPKLLLKLQRHLRYSLEDISTAAKSLELFFPARRFSGDLIELEVRLGEAGPGLRYFEVLDTADEEAPRLYGVGRLKMDAEGLGACLSYYENRALMGRLGLYHVSDVMTICNLLGTVAPRLCAVLNKESESLAFNYHPSLTVYLDTQKLPERIWGRNGPSVPPLADWEAQAATRDFLAQVHWPPDCQWV
jgi:hypothetical protein